ncbi:MAG: hypothetical protein AB2807_11080 [Candidatus Sedimenticola endophacoides]
MPHARPGNGQIRAAAVNRDAGGTDSTLAFYMKHGIHNLSAYSDLLGLFAHGMHVGKVPVTIYIDSRGREFGRLSGLVDWDSGEARQHIRHCLLGQ